MAQVFAPPEHPRNLRHGLNFHGRTGPAPIPRVVVRIDRHRQRIRRPRHRMRRLQHLPGIERMEVGIVVREPLRRLLQHCGHRPGIGIAPPCRFEARQRAKLPLQHFGSAGQQFGDKILGHGDPPTYHSRVCRRKLLILIDIAICQHRTVQPK